MDAVARKLVLVGGRARAHTPTICKRVNNSAHFHTKSWSYRFECRVCGKARRYNTNFLGSRYRLVCDGLKIVRVHRDECPNEYVGRVCCAEVTEEGTR